jgi:hypothetical protein
MVHHLDYIELTWSISVGLGAFRILSQFAIKMIAIFARKKTSERAFEVLRISWTERAIGSLRDKDRVSGTQARQQSGVPTSEPSACQQRHETGTAGPRIRSNDP